MFEAFTMLAAIAQHTNTIKLGQMVTCAAYRNAGLLAKEAACVDVFSGGRLILGIGAGWYEREYQAYGFPFPSGGTRLQILEETVEVIKRLWTDETVTYAGKHLAFDGAYCDPKPIQQLPEIWIGGGGEKVTLRIEARHADKTNWQTGIEGFVRKSNLLRGYCEDIGRDFDTIVRTHGPDCRVFDTEADMKKWLDSPGGGSLWGGGDPDEYVRDNLVGTAEQVAEKAQEFVDAGCREFVLWFRDFPSSDSLEAVARDVVPHVHL
jgi:alkanesulfonate monooxygenase SsuD/methylene tetrahydromethanopterin reductase-like flavin-dependent oxidoreductase (luciferase family)